MEKFNKNIGKGTFLGISNPLYFVKFEGKIDLKVILEEQVSPIYSEPYFPYVERKF